MCECSEMRMNPKGYCAWKVACVHEQIFDPDFTNVFPFSEPIRFLKYCLVSLLSLTCIRISAWAYTVSQHWNTRLNCQFLFGLSNTFAAFLSRHVFLLLSTEEINQTIPIVLSPLRYKHVQNIPNRFFCLRCLESLHLNCCKLCTVWRVDRLVSWVLFIIAMCLWKKM